MNKISKSFGKGQALSEFAIIMPVLLVFIFLIVDLSRVAYCYSVVVNSAREAARFATARPGVDAGDIYQAAEQLAGGLDISTSILEISDDKVIIRVSYTFEPATPILWNLIGDGEIDLSSEATMQIEQ